MKNSWKKFLIVFAITCTVLYGVQFLVIPFVQEGSIGNYEFDPAKSDDDFMLAQYYFNHDDDPSGPYDLKKARYHYERVITINPLAHEQVWYQLGRIDFLEGDYAAALHKFSKQREYFGDKVPNVYYMIGLTHGYQASETGSLEDWLAAEEAFITYLSLDPGSPWARTDLSWVYFAQGKYRDMLPVLMIGLENDSLHPWLLNMYGLALHNLGQKEEANTYFTQASVEIEKLTVNDWGRAYPGNNPRHWSLGLSEFASIVEANKQLTR
jgi:tetratricopeptide (TPR) repeat protein